MTMKCAKFHKMIGDSLDGSIRPQDRARLESHLETCAECRELAVDFQKIAAEAKSLPSEEPGDDVWPAIRAAVRRPRNTRPAPLFAQRRFVWVGAAGLLFIGTAIGLIVGLHPWTSQPLSALALGERQTMAKLKEAENYCQLAIQAMTEALKPGPNGLDPQTAALFKRDLQVVDAAIESCRTAVAGAPANLDARVFLLGAYRKKIDVLNGFIDLRKKNPVPPGL
jgi:predicted anti-sigma-YlaC factor YlaD